MHRELEYVRFVGGWVKGEERKSISKSQKDTAGRSKVDRPTS